MAVSITFTLVLLACLGLLSALHSAVSTISGGATASVSVECQTEEEAHRGKLKTERLLIGLRLASAICFAGMIIAVSGAPSRLLATLLSRFVSGEGLSQMLASAILTLSTGVVALLFGEIIPAALAARDPVAVATRLTRPISVALKVFGPLPRLVHKAVRRVREKSVSFGSAGASEDDIRHLAQEVREAGVIEEGEREIIDRVFRLGDRPVSSVMTPRADVIVLSADGNPQELLDRALESGVTRFPVLGEGGEEVLGVVTLQGLVSLASRPSTVPGGLRALIEPPLQVPESMTALQLLSHFRERGQRLAVIVDEYGGFAGVATLTDVLQVLVGEIKPDGEHERAIVARPDGSLLVDASIDIENLFERLGLRTFGDPSSGEFHSLGGFVMTSLGHVPQEGEQFVSFGHSFEVVDMDGNRIDKVLVAAAPAKRAVG